MFGLLTLAHDDKPGSLDRQTDGRQPIRASENSIAACDRCQKLQRPFGFIAIAGVVCQGMQAAKKNRSRRVTRGRGRILKRFAAGAQNAERRDRSFTIEKATAHGSKNLAIIASPMAWAVVKYRSSPVAS